MELVAFADLHAHLFTDFADHDEKCENTRLRDILWCLQDIRSYCVHNRIEHVLFAGDLFHKRVTVDTRVHNLIRDEIRDFGAYNIKIVMIPGNHCQVDNSDFPQHSLYSFKEFEHVILLDRFTPVVIGEGKDLCRIFPVPYSKNAEMVKEAINDYVQKAAEQPEVPSVLLGHLGVSGAFVGKSSYAMADAFTVDDLHPEAFTFGVFGHFHKWQYLGDTKHFFYTGAPIQHSFNDEGQGKGFWVLDTKEKKAGLMPISNPKFLTVTDWKKAKFNELMGNFIRFQVPSTEVDELLEKIPDGLKYRLEIETVYNEERRSDIDISMSFPEILKSWAKDMKPEVIDIGLDILREAETG